jgi:hypothetical protein
MEEKLILKHRGDFDYFLLSRTENYEAVIASLNADELEQKLCKENCDEIFGVVDVDVDKLVDEYIVVKPKYREHEHNLSASAYKQGFNKAMELNKDKVFTLEDVRMAIAYGEIHRDMDAGKVPYQTFVEFIQSLQQPTEIEVDVVNLMDCQAQGSCDETKTTCRICTNTGIPRLDSDNCLILKQKS